MTLLARVDGAMRAKVTIVMLGLLAASLAGCGVGNNSADSGIAPATAAQESLPKAGPELLRWPAADPPQFRNSGVWTAEPILTSGASAYRNGEFLYQDYIYDDWGATSGGTDPDPGAGGVSVSPATGQYRYPTDPVYVRNAADLVELRLKLVEGGTAFRVAYNSMLNPDLVATTLALGSSSAAVAMPHDANASMPAMIFATVHGNQVEVVDAATGNALQGTGATGSSNLGRRQAEVFIPFSVFDPRGQTAMRIGAATGLWDVANNRYLVPQANADESHPGGAGGLANPPAFFNVAFRYGDSGSWHESGQGAALGSGDLSTYFATVDFTKVASGVNDEMPDQAGGTPKHGAMARIYASHFEDQQGRGPKSPDAAGCAQPCDFIWPLAGNLQPYSLYVPSKEPPPAGYGLTYSLHPCGGNYSGGSGTTNALGDRGTGSLVVWPGGRAPCEWYWGQASAELFEIWADLARYYTLDPAFVALTGASMGGYGTLRTSTLWPDLFVKGAATIPCIAAETNWAGPPAAPTSGEQAVVLHTAESERHVPLLIGIGNVDTTCTHGAQRMFRDTLDSSGYRYDFREYQGDHVGGGVAATALLAPEFAAFLANDRLAGDPPHVTYVMNLKANEARYGLNADRAYWVSELRLRDETGDALFGRIDVYSHGFGLGDPPPLPTQQTTGPGYTGQKKEWGEAQPAPVVSVLDLVVENIRSVTIDTQRARVGCDVSLNVQTDGPVDVRLSGCSKTVSFR